ncbi:MAG: helix-turn-helix domain-containing protein [Clostridiales bacterium]|nr:helix-turn-helix domain-containing protein [Clostridiales bacterium]
MGRKRVEINPESGKRLNQWLTANNMTGKQLAERLNYTQQQISKIINGKANLTLDMAKQISELSSDSLLDRVRVQWLMCQDDFMTGKDIVSATTENKFTKRELIENLLTLHGYLIEDITEQQPIMTDEKGRQYRKPLFAFVAPSGTRCYFTEKQLAAFIQQIDNYVEMSAMFLFRKLEGAAPAKPKRGEG